MFASGNESEVTIYETSENKANLDKNPKIVARLSEMRRLHPMVQSR